ncbi:MAG: copper chaperone PCu(A)C, partial [Phenylobacterium sp.]|nr:copper chaperone PCu(A)C [Phenylobacterium sp.]
MASPAAAASPTVKAVDAWCRAAPVGAPAGGCYVTLTASAEDRLVALETPAADHGEIHTMSMTDGIMRMRRLAD